MATDIYLINRFVYLVTPHHTFFLQDKGELKISSYSKDYLSALVEDGSAVKLPIDGAVIHNAIMETYDNG